MAVVSNSLLLCGIILFTLGVVITDGFLPVNIPEINDAILFKWLLKATFRDIGLILIVSTVIITNIVTPLIDTSVSQCIKIIITLIVCIVLIILNCTSYVKYNSIYKILIKDEFSDKFKKILTKKLTDSERVKYEDLLAQVYYVKHNRLITLRDINGNKTIYHPTPDMVKAKKSNDNAIYLLHWITTRTIYSAIMWLFVPIVSSLVGILSIKKQNPKSMT